MTKGRQQHNDPNRPQERHIDKAQFKQIFRDHWDDFKAEHPRYNTPYYDSIIQKMLNCGDPEKMGFLQYRCCYCGETRKIGFSCKCCFCLSCAKVYTDSWVDFIGRRLLPGVTYRHIVLTVPKYLHHWFYRYPDLLLSPLMRSGNACLKDVFNLIKKNPLKIGTVIVVQTSGRAGNFNPHLHILVTAGGIDKNVKWCDIDYIPYELLHKKWQYYLLQMLRQHVKDPKVKKDIDYCWKNYNDGFVAFVQPGDVPPGGKGLAQYLAKYLVSPPISVRRIEQYDGKNVRYWYRDHLTESIQKVSLPVLKFIGRMVQHILPKGFQRIRYYGLHGNRCYEIMREQIQTLLPPNNQKEDPLGFRVLPRKSFVQLFFEAFNKNPLLCPRCKEEMDLELIYHPKYGTMRHFFDEDFEKYNAQQKEKQKKEKEIKRASSQLGRRSMDRSEQLVLLPLQKL